MTRKDAIEAIKCNWPDSGYTILREALDMAVKALDAVPVVRCRECIHYEMGVCLKIYDDGAASRYAWQERKPDDFCSYGKLKEGADNEP